MMINKSESNIQSYKEIKEIKEISSKNNILINSSKEEEEQETRDDSHYNNKNGLLPEEIPDKKLIELIPSEPKLNNIQNRLFILSPIVDLGFERECNKYDFINSGKKPLGKGAFGEVWKVIHDNSNKVYCIKKINKRDIFEQKMVNQLNKEISIMYNINHPYSIKLINHFEDNEKLYLILELAENGSVYDYIQNNRKNKKKINIDFIKKIIIETIEIIKYLHSLNIMYRDIKPENILLDENLDIKLCDYGWSTYFNPGEYLRTYCGTPEYVSPELIKRQPYNEKVDIWGIGVLIFELVVGYPPFCSNFNEDRFNNIKKCKIEWPSSDEDNFFDNEVKDLISKILKVNPDERLSLEEIENHPWLKNTYEKLKKEKKTNSTMNIQELFYNEMYKMRIMNNGIDKVSNYGSYSKRLGRVYNQCNYEDEGILNDKEIMNLYKVENRQLKIKILKVEERNKYLEKKCCDYDDLCFLNEKLNKKTEENLKQILFLKSICEQREKLIKENEKKINEIFTLKKQVDDLKEYKLKYETIKQEYDKFKKFYESNNNNFNNTINNSLINIKDSDIPSELHKILCEFKIEQEKFINYSKTNINLVENDLNKSFSNHIQEVSKIFNEYCSMNDKAYKTIDFLNSKMTELYGYRGKAERFQAEVEMLRKEEKILKNHLSIHKKISDESRKANKIKTEKIEKLESEIKEMKKVLELSKQFITRHFSVSIQKQYYKEININQNYE